MIKKPTIYLIAIALITSLLTGSASATNTPSSKPATLKPPCRIDMQVAHESSSMRKIHQTIAVKANVVIICDRPLSNVVVRIALYKKAHPTAVYLNSVEREPIRFLPANTPRKISGKPFICLNWKSTAFFVVVGSTAVLDGKVVTAPVRRSFSKIVECGS